MSAPPETAPSSSPTAPTSVVATARAQRPSILWGIALGALIGLLVRDLDLPALVSFDGPREPLVVLAAALGGALMLTRLRAAVFAAAWALGLLWCVVAFSPLCGWLAEGLARREAAEPADAIFVSFSGLRPDARRLAEVQTRAFHAVQLLVRGKAPRIVVTESDVPGVAAVRDAMEAMSAKGEVLVGERAETTHEEAVVVARLARDRALRILLVVTSPIHSRRSCAALEKEGLTVVSTPAPETRFDLETLDTSGDRLAAFGSVTHERLGLWVYARRGWVVEG
jgi:uncharacterized SAM-binding protein YcdF (DUF218 family)